MAGVTALDVRMTQGAERPDVQRVTTTLNSVRLALEEIDRLAATNPLVRPRWVVEDMGHDLSFFTVRLTAADNALRERESLLLPVSALVDGVHELREQPVLPDYYSESTVNRLVRVAQPRGGIERVSLATVNGVAGRFEDLDDAVAQHGRQAIEGDEISIGSVTGFVHQIKKVKRGVRATVFDPVRHRAVSCSAPDGMEEQLRQAWPHRVVARGKITRNARGQAIRIALSNLELLPEHDSQRPPAVTLRGALPGMTGGLTTEEFMREVRRG